jgi:hypothetical protein
MILAHKNPRTQWSMATDLVSCPGGININGKFTARLFLTLLNRLYFRRMALIYTILDFGLRNA